MTVSFLPWGILFPATMLDSEWFAVLATFVAINTLVYMALAVSKVLPKVYFSDYVNRRDRRLHNRSIHPSPDDPRP